MGSETQGQRDGDAMIVVKRSSGMLVIVKSVGCRSQAGSSLKSTAVECTVPRLEVAGGKGS